MTGRGGRRKGMNIEFAEGEPAALNFEFCMMKLFVCGVGELLDK